MANDVVGILNPAHMRFRDVDGQVGQLRQVSPITARERQRAAAERMGALHGAHYVR